jgi:segregation and condensation protein B
MGQPQGLPVHTRFFNYDTAFHSSFSFFSSNLVAILEQQLAQHLEALIFTTEHPVTLTELQTALEAALDTKLDAQTLLDSIEILKARYADPMFAFEIVEIAEGYQFLTKGAFHHSVGTYLKQTIKKRLSQAALETLSIVAYRQPISKTEVEQIRGVSCDYAIQKLLEKELVTITGRSDAPGRPLLYATSERFMDYFGIKSLRDLPKTKDFATAENTIGETSTIVE